MGIEVIEPLVPELRRDRLGDGVSAQIEHIAFEVGDIGQRGTWRAGVRPKPSP